MTVAAEMTFRSFEMRQTEAGLLLDAAFDLLLHLIVQGLLASAGLVSLLFSLGGVTGAAAGTGIATATASIALATGMLSRSAAESVRRHLRYLALVAKTLEAIKDRLGCVSYGVLLCEAGLHLLFELIFLLFHGFELLFLRILLGLRRRFNALQEILRSRSWTFILGGDNSAQNIDEADRHENTKLGHFRSSKYATFLKIRRQYSSASASFHSLYSRPRGRAIKPAAAQLSTMFGLGARWADGRFPFPLSR